MEATKFEPITTQEALDAIIGKRVKQEKALRTEVDNLKGQLAAKDSEVARARAEAAVDLALEKSGVAQTGKAGVVKRLIDFDSETPVTEQLDALATEAPDLFKVPTGAGSGGSAKPVGQPEEKPLTEEDIQNMPQEERLKPENMSRIDRFIQRQREGWGA
jgi:hypothetical protein